MDHNFYKVLHFWYYLRIEMSIVNLKIIFVKKQKQTRECPIQGWGATLEKDYSCETGYPFDDSHQIGDTS